MSITPEPAPLSVPEVGYPLPPPATKKRVLWKWSLAATAVFFVFLMWQCGSALLQGRARSNLAVQRFHQELNEQNYNQIVNEADPAFEAENKRQELIQVLQAVHRKLGEAGEFSLVNINVSATTSGTFTTCIYQTRFENDTAVETFVWEKAINGDLKLYRYNIQSNQLILR